MSAFGRLGAGGAFGDSLVEASSGLDRHIDLSVGTGGSDEIVTITKAAGPYGVGLGAIPAPLLDFEEIPGLRPSGRTYHLRTRRQSLDSKGVRYVVRKWYGFWYAE